MYDTIIIGAGMSGLAAGIRLAHFGKRVCILERHSAIGGLNSFYRQRGRTFDVGLHALTNYAPKGTRSGPLARLLKQLRLAWEEWALAPQLGSAIAFPGATLRFSNNFELFEGEVRRVFPREIDNLRRLLRQAARLRPVWPGRRRPFRPPGARRHHRRAALGRNGSLPDPFLRRLARARHRLRPVQHPVSVDFFGRAGPAVGRNPIDSENAGPPVQGIGRRVAAARRWPGSPSRATG